MAGLQDQFKTRGPGKDVASKSKGRSPEETARLRQQALGGPTLPGKPIASSNGASVSTNPISNETSASTTAEPASPFNLAGGGLNSDISPFATKTSTQDPGATNAQEKDGLKKQDTIRPNPLNEYISYTYNFKLGIMTPDMYNAFVDGDYDSLNSNLLMATGGIPAENRVPYFDVDFYLEDLEMESFVGLQQVTGGANVTKINFKITEPNGITFFNRLIAASEALGIKNYIDTPYFLKIDFVGYDDIEGSHVSSKQPIPFIIPIKLADIKSSVTAMGGTYDVEAVAFYDSPLFSNQCSIQEGFSSKNPKTVGDFFDSLTDYYNNSYKKATEKHRVTDPQQQFSEDFYHTIEFDIDEEIRNAPIKFQQDAKTVDRAPMHPPAIDLGGAAMAKLIADKTKSVDTSEIKLDFPAGMNIIKIINSVIVQNSDYIKKQKLNPEEVKKIETNLDADSQRRQLEELNSKLETPLTWYKIRTSKKLKKFNTGLQVYARHNVFKITKYTVQNKTVENYPGWGESKPVKRYDYIFTGKNDSVLGFDINFNTLYYQVVLGNPDKQKQASGEAKKSGEQQTKFEKNEAGDAETVGGVQPGQAAIVMPGVAEASNTDGSNFEQQADRVLERNLYVDHMGDMIEVNLNIIGDPDFLVGYNEADFTDENLNVLNSAEEITCYVSYRTPDDFDDNTGMLKPQTDPTYMDSSFSGVYRINQINNNFSSGAFTQTLTMQRLFNQPGLGTKPRKSGGGKVEPVSSGTGGSPVTVSPGDRVFTGLASGATTQPENKAPLDAPVRTDNATSLGNQPNVATSNGSSVVGGLRTG